MNKQQASKTPDGTSSLLRKVIVLLAGGILVAIGLIMLVLPGPAIVFIPLGLAVLATEFRWAKKTGSLRLVNGFVVGSENISVEKMNDEPARS